MSLVDRLAHQLAGGPAEPIVAPWPVTDADLEELGKGHAGTYFRIGRRRGWEYILPAFPVVLSEHDDLPAAAILERQAPDGSRAYVALREVPVGSYAAAVVPKRAKAPAPAGLVDALAQAAMLNPAAGAIRGAGAVLKRIQSKGDALRLVGDALLLVSPGGRPHPHVRDAVELARPLLMPYLRDGKAPTCALGCGAEATTIALLDTLWCGECRP